MRLGTAILSLLVAATGLVSGCAASIGPDLLEIGPGAYDAAFDAALAAAREEGLPAALRDRRAGIIETEATIAPSIFEPWSADAASPESRYESTLALQRRRARFEFTPALSTADAGDDERLAGPDVLGLTHAEADRTRLEAPMRLTVSVWVERAHQPGLRRGTWTRRATTRTRIAVGGRGEDADELAPAVHWTPVTRDREIERRLLDRVATALGRTPSGPPGTP